MLRSGTDLGDVVVAHRAVFVRVDLAAIDPHGYRHLVRSIERRTSKGAGANVVRALLADRWVGVEDRTVTAFARSLDPGAHPPAGHLNDLRNSVALSFAQSWDTWASIHEVSSSGGTTEYSLEMPVRAFVGTFAKDLRGRLLKDVPGASGMFGDLTAAISSIPSKLTIPMKLWISAGSLTRLEIDYKGNALDLAISHPVVGVSAPTSAAMLTTRDISGLLADYGVCLGAPSSSSAAARSCSESMLAPDLGGVSPSSGTCTTIEGPGGMPTVSCSGGGGSWSGTSPAAGASSSSSGDAAQGAPSGAAPSSRSSGASSSPSSAASTPTGSD